MYKVSFLFSFLVILISTFALADESRVVLTVTGIKSQTGNIHCAIWNSSKGYPADSKLAVQSEVAAIQMDQATCSFRVPAGVYAVAAYHDENSNGKLDSNFLGIPSEGVGASNDAKGHFGPPSFDDAKFIHNDGVLNIRLKLAY